VGEVEKVDGGREKGEEGESEGERRESGGWEEGFPFEDGVGGALQKFTKDRERLSKSMTEERG